jgi:hypothetical protein
MKLLAGGCSLIYGDEMPDVNSIELGYSNLTYTALLAKHFDLEYTCVANSGAGNDAICRRVIERTTADVDLVVVNWSYYNRFEFHYKDIGWQSLKCPNTKFEDRISVLSKPFYSEITDMYSGYKYLQNIILLQTFLIAKKISFIFSSSEPEFFNESADIKRDLYYKQLYSLIDFSKWFFWKNPTTNQNTGFVYWTKKNNYPTGPGNHPLELAHLKTYELILPQMEAFYDHNNR